MRKEAALVAIAGCLVLSCTGCAKKEALKAEEMPSPPVATEAPAPQPRVATQLPGHGMEPQPAAEVKTAVQESTPEQPTLTPAPPELQKIFFDFDSYVLSPASLDTLQKNAEVLRKEGRKLVIEGHCDERGSDEYNLALGERRARAAQQYLINMGFPQEMVETISYGEDKPVDPGHSEDAWAKNRRDEFVLQEK